jgi:hypothetical protein
MSFRCEKTGCNARLTDGAIIHGDSYFDETNGSLIIRGTVANDEPAFADNLHYEIRSYDHWWDRRSGGISTIVLSLGQYVRTPGLQEYLSS